MKAVALQYRTRIRRYLTGLCKLLLSFNQSRKG
jgi:hypothetical protein